MYCSLRSGWLVWLGVGLAGGLILGGLWPHTPLHAVATDRIDTFAMATGPLDEDVEAVYFLDFLTGDLRAVALGKQSGKFNACFNYNVLKDLGVDPTKNPRFLMVTGVADLRRRGGAGSQPSRAVVYVAEVTTGRVAAYYAPWSTGYHATGQPIVGALRPLDMTQFRAAGPAGGAVLSK